MRFLCTLAGIVLFAFLLARAVDVELGVPSAASVPGFSFADRIPAEIQVQLPQDDAA